MESNKNRWLHHDDFEQDLYEVSDFVNSPPRSPINLSTKPNAHVRKARGKASIYEQESDDDENIVLPKARGRGSSLLWNDQYVTPGGVPSFLQKQKETTKDIRMVTANGFGYCNDQIEHMLKVNKTKHDVKPMDVRLKASPSKSPYLTSAGSQGPVNGEKPPLPLYDIIKGKVPKPVHNKSSNDNSLNIASHIDFPKL
ncbi:hypothetical protein RN001_013266 [Aquatica leii]|uniref:Uncharacterized protein n=1 Tax=Aquatica leii TaxID=1421715 RepID=A0AAN7P471_9COLE|nr:hypothetical protein RN001_013266 [Aquatica leii]